MYENPKNDGFSCYADPDLYHLELSLQVNGNYAMLKICWR